MNCPQCGTSVSTDQQFCRACGAALTTDLVSTSGDHPYSRAQRIRLAGFISIFAGLAVALTGSMLLHSQMVVYIGVLMNFLGMFLVVLPAVVPARPRSAALETRDRSEAAISAPTTKKLTPMDENFGIPSVTENTTDLLKTPIRSEDPLP